MNITSYNVTDVGYHYIGMRVLANLPSDSSKEAQFDGISRNVLKYASDRALRLMLPAPRGDFQSLGNKVCQELVHMQLAEASVGEGYRLTDTGRTAVQMLNQGRHLELRRMMVALHVKTYDNLRLMLSRQLDGRAIWLPVVDTRKSAESDYIVHLLKPTLGNRAESPATLLPSIDSTLPPKKLEDFLRGLVLSSVFLNARVSLPIFRSICDRLSSLRLLNIMKATAESCEFAKSYSPCRSTAPVPEWYFSLTLSLPHGDPFILYLSEPNMKDAQMRELLLAAIDEAFQRLEAQAGYYDLPQVRDIACEKLMIPEAAFDEGVNELLDLEPAPVTVGLSYEGISGRRKPLARVRQSTQIFNLIRRV